MYGQGSAHAETDDSNFGASFGAQKVSRALNVGNCPCPVQIVHVVSSGFVIDRDFACATNQIETLKRDCLS